MSNGFEINITEADFKAKKTEEQNWILFLGVVAVNRCLKNLDDEGCQWGQKKNKITVLKKLSALGGGVTFALGIIYIIYQIICR